MKKRVAIVAAGMMMFAAMTASAQPGVFSSLEKHQSMDLSKVTCRYAEGLKSGIDGVVESSLAHLVRMKLFVPDLQCPNVREEIAKLASDGSTPRIRYKAYLASLVFDSPQIFKAESTQNFAGADELFSTVASRLQVALIQDASIAYSR
jgi:hypothetical protein